LRVLGDHQGRRIERRLHRRAGGARAAVIERSTAEADHWNERERENRSNAAMLVGEKS